MRASTFFLGVAAGTVAAAVTVLYSTPKSGSEIRSSVKNVDWKESFNELKMKLNKLKESASNLSKEAKTQIPEAVNGLKHSFGDWQDSNEPTEQRLEKELTAIQEALDNLEKSIVAQQK